MAEILQHGIASQYDKNASRYDRAARFNILAAERLVAAIPPGDYTQLLDVGCGTGFATLAALARFPTLREVTGVDISAGMVDQFREKLGAHPGVQMHLQVADVLQMDAPPGGADLVVSSMMLHWIANRGAAIGAMARALRGGGVLALVAPGPGHDREYVEVLREIRPRVPQRMIDVFDAAQVFPDALTEQLRGVDMEPLDVWVETHSRHVTPDDYMDRIVTVGSHLWSHLSPEEQAATLARVRAGIEAASGPAGFSYTFTKTFATARHRV